MKPESPSGQSYCQRLFSEAREASRWILGDNGKSAVCWKRERSIPPHPSPLPKEREERFLPRDESERLEFAETLPAGLPLPRGEGWGEGEQRPGIRRTPGFCSRLSDFGFLPRTLLLLLVGSSVCFGQRQNEPRPAPLDPVQAEQEARALVAAMLAQKPDQNATSTGSVKIRDAAGKTREIPVRFEISSTPTNWVSVYETLPSATQPGGLKLTVIHADEQPNCYTLLDPAAAGATNAAARRLTPDQIMTPFASSDFWIADLGLEFLHWPKQRLLRKEMRHSKSCNVLESLNPAPVPGGYARVVSWIMIESPHGIVHADAYDARGELLKRFDPKSLEKVQGEYQLEEMEIRNRKTGSQTVIKFDLADTAPAEAAR
jgi:hypothetical protein